MIIELHYCAICLLFQKECLHNLTEPIAMLCSEIYSDNVIHLYAVMLVTCVATIMV